MEVNVFGRNYFIKKGFLLVLAILLIIGSGVLGYFLKQVYQPLEEPVLEKALLNNEALQDGIKDTNLTEEKADQKIKVYIVGCVNKPGVVTLTKGEVIEDAIREAGGATKEADLENINLAFELDQNTMLRIKAKAVLLGNNMSQTKSVSAGKQTVTAGKQKSTAGEQASSAAASSVNTTAAVQGQVDTLNSGVDIISDSLGAVVTDQQEKLGENKKSSIVNINTATQAELEELPTVGPATAKAIIDYRDKKGKFEKITDIMKITGIKQKTFEKIKDYICV